MSELPQAPVAPLSVDTALRPVDELDPAQRPNLAGFVANLRVLSVLASAAFGGPLLLALLGVMGASRPVALGLSFIVVVPLGVAWVTHRGARHADAGAPFHAELQRVLWIVWAPLPLSLLAALLWALHVVVVAGGVDAAALRQAATTPTVAAHLQLVDALGFAALVWGPAYALLVLALTGQQGLRSWTRGVVWVVAVAGWLAVLVCDPWHALVGAVGP